MPKPKSRRPLIRKLLRRGIHYQREGRPELAEECYRNALKVDPRCGEALRLRGVVARQPAPFGESIESLRAALALDPDNPDKLTRLAESYLGQGEMEPALLHYRRVVDLFPQSAEAYANLGQAEELFGNLTAAADSFRRALQFRPHSPALNCKLANLLRRLKDLPEALRLYEYALSLDPDRFETHRDLGVVLTDMKNLEAAGKAFERSLALKPDSAQTFLTLSYFRFRCGDVPRAADWARRAIELDPQMHLAHLALGSIYSQMGEWAEALKCYERAKALCPYSADVNFFTGLVHLSQGKFALGWNEYEDRDDARRVRRMYPQPQWKGEPLEGARIFLHAEQGLGDTLQAVRYVPLVAARGGQVVLAVQPRLYRLLAGTEGASQVITDGGTVSDFRWQCPLLSLPLAFGTKLDTIPAKIPYVHPDAVLAQAWRQRLCGNSLRIGLAWGGDPKHVHDIRRSMPLEHLVPLTYIAGATFYSLQMGPPAEQVKQMGSRVRLIDLQDEQNDFADTAAIVANLDLVISIDTAVVHLAGALGKPVWVLLAKSPDWRWMLEREDSPWYPTARLFRQSTMGNWQEVVARVEGELRELVAKTAAVASLPERPPAAATALTERPPAVGDCGCSPPVTSQPGEEATPGGGPSAPRRLSLRPQIRKLLKKGIAHHQAGRRRQAETCYRSSLKIDPRCPQALHLLGLLAQQASQYQESIRLMGEALALDPDDPDTLNSLADSHIGLNQMPLASQCLKRLTELLPQSAEAHRRLGQTQERQENWDAAAASYRRALALAPNSPDYHSSLAMLQYKQGAFADSAETCRRALVLDPTRHDIHTQLGNALTDLGNYGAAVESHRRALTLKPDSALGIFSLGYFFERKGDFAFANEAFQRALKLDPRLGGAHLHLGIMSILRGDLDEAAACFERVVKLTPENAEARSFLGLIHLTQGNYRLGWGEYEHRRHTPQFIRDHRTFSQPLWKGEPLEGSRILLYAEQGLGDTLEFVRYVPLVAARGGKVVLEIPSRLHRLLAHTPGAVEVLRPGETLPDFNWQCPLLSLPLALGTELHTIPAEIPYIYPGPAQAEAWRQHLAGNSLRIGLVWGGSPLHPHDALRSIPLELLAPLTRVEGTTFYSLQMGAPAEQVKQMGDRVNLVDLRNEQKDFADTAAIVASLDLVISIDTSVAHLAGAMGRPVWVILSKSADWRWLLDREDSPWYPTVRLFRQTTLGNWQDAVARVEGELRELIARTFPATRNGILPG